MFLATVVIAASAAVYGCSTAPAKQRASGGASATTATSSPGGSPATPVVGAATTVTTNPSSPPATPAAQNLSVTNEVRSQLLQAGAALNSLPATAYSGLAPGMTYYAYDPATKTYWAGAKLVPSPSSLPAQVSVQDDGAYDVFTQAAGGSWVAHLDGMGGIGGTKCMAIPQSVLAAWKWAPASCRPHA